LIARDFVQGRTPWSAARLASELDIPGIALAPVVQSLEKGGFLLATEQEHFVPGRNLDSIRLVEIFEALRTGPPDRLTIAVRPVAPAIALMGDIKSAIAACLAGQSLKDLSAR
jgi:hypothetical protein